MSKRYKCPYCEERLEKEKLISHVEDEHEDLIPEKQTPTQVVFNSINKKTHGICVACKKDTEWNEKAGKYNRLCNDPKCKEKLRQEFKKNAINKRGIYNFAADPQFQEKMLKGRKISSTYKFTDGGKVDYVGSYEKKFLEFCDKVMGIESKDIMGPGPIIEYSYNGAIHHWITDFYYVPANLVLDIKDGGDNPNTRPMEEYREKQIAKEKSIRELKKYNYLRLTNNNFSQFMEVLADLKSMALDITQTQLVHKINESVSIEELSAGMSTVPPQWATDANVMITNNMAGESRIALSSLDFNDSILVDDDEEIIKKISKQEFRENYTIKDQFLYPKNEKYYNLLEAFKNHNATDTIYMSLTSFNQVTTENMIYFDNDFKKLANKGVDQNVFDLFKKVEKVNGALELDIHDDSIGITLPRLDLDKGYDIESILKDGKPATRIKLNNSVIATFNKTAAELGIEDYEKIEESVNILMEDNQDGFFMITPTSNKEKLDDAFQQFNAQNDDQKLKADTRSLSLYGLNNYDHYHVLLSKITQGTKDDETESLSYNKDDKKVVQEDYTPGSIIFNCEYFGTQNPNELFEKIDSAKDFNMHTTGRVIIYPTQNAEELESLYLRYMALSADDKASSDNKAFEMFAKTNREIYQFTKENIIKAKNDEVENTHSVEDQEIENAVNESIVFDKNDLYYNFDKFENGKSNILLITGLSGSGKSTLAEQLASKYKAEYIELDAVTDIAYFKTIPEVFKDFYSINKKDYDLIITGKRLPDKDFYRIHEKFIKFCVSWCKKQKPKKFIIEGIEIYELFKEEAKSYPLIIKGTSALKSAYRKMVTREDWSNKEIIKDGPGILKWLIDSDKDLNDIRKSLKESVFVNDLPLVTPEELSNNIHEDYSCFNIEEAEAIKKWRKSYINEDAFNYRELNLKRINILRKAIYQNNNEAIIQCGWNPEIEFNSENRAKATKIIKENIKD